MTISRTQMILLGVAAVLILIVGIFAGRGCSEPPPTTSVIGTGIDAGPGEAEINARLDGALRAGEVRIEQIEEKFEEDMAAFDARQREEYDRLRGGDNLEAAAQYLSDWNRHRRDAGR